MQCLLRVLCIFTFFLGVSSIQSITISDETNGEIKSTFLDVRTGCFYVGTVSDGTNPSLLKFIPKKNSEPLVETSIHTDAIGKHFNYLSLVRTQPTNTTSFLVAATSNTSINLLNKIIVTDETTFTSSNDVTAFACSGSGIYFYCDLEDENAHIIQLTTNMSNKIFVITKNSEDNWLSTSSALNVYSINSTELTVSLIEQCRILESHFLVGNTSSTVEDVSDSVLTHYDSDLKMLYIASKQIQSQSSISDGVRSISAYAINETTGVATFTALHGSADTNTSIGWGNASSNTAKHLIGVVGGNKTLSVHALSTMKASNGQYYLIVAGGHDTSGNTIWALPLVKAGYNNAGTLASIADLTCTTQAPNSTYLGSSATTSIQVGKGVLPWPSSITPSCMQVIGNTVYIATNDNSEGNAGIYFSQIILGGNNEMIGWTPWKKAAHTRLGETTTNGSIAQFAVSTKTGKIWAVPGSSYTVKSNTWQNINRSRITRAGEQTPTESALQNFLTNPSVIKNCKVSECNLPAPLTVYGGYLSADKPGVIFVRKNETDTTASEDNLKITELPLGSEKILSFNFTGWSYNDEPVMIPLVGTQTGLYAFIHSTLNTGGKPSDDGDMVNFSDDFWEQGTWKKILPNLLNGNITGISTKNNGLYITHRKHEKTNIKDFVYRFDMVDILANTILNAPPTLVAQSGEKIHRIYSAAPLTTINTQTEQIYLGTEKGVLYSNIPGGSQQASEETFKTTEWGTVPASTKKAGVQMMVKDYGLVAIAIDNKANVSEILLQASFNEDGTQSVVTATETSVNSAILSNINTLGTIFWTDGARILHFENSTFTAKQSNDSTISTNLSETESILNGKKIVDIQLKESGIIEITTDTSEVIELN